MGCTYLVHLILMANKSCDKRSMSGLFLNGEAPPSLITHSFYATLFLIIHQPSLGSILNPSFFRLCATIIVYVLNHGKYCINMNISVKKILSNSLKKKQVLVSLILLAPLWQTYVLLVVTFLKPLMRTWTCQTTKLENLALYSLI